MLGYSVNVTFNVAKNKNSTEKNSSHWANPEKTLSTVRPPVVAELVVLMKRAINICLAVYRFKEETFTTKDVMPWSRSAIEDQQINEKDSGIARISNAIHHYKKKWVIYRVT